MKTLYAIALLSGAVCCAQPMQAKIVHPTSRHPKEIAGSKSDEQRNDSVMHHTLEENSPGEFHMPGVARFAFRGRENKFYLSVGGYAKTTVSYDFGSPLSNPNEFIVADIPMHPAPGNGGQIQFSAMQSHLCLNFVGLPETDNQIGVFIGANFLNDYSPVLQFAYMRYRGIKAGYDYSIFSDPDAGVNTIDYEGPNASTAIPVALVEYSHSFGKHKEWTVGGGLQNPMYSVTTGKHTTAVNQRMPDIPVFARYSWDGGDSWIRMAAVFRQLLYHNASGSNVAKLGWGIQISGSAVLTPALTAYWQGVYGRGISSYIQDLYGAGLDMTPDPSNPYVMNPVKAWGGYAGLQYEISPKVSCGAAYSHVRTYADRYNGGETSWNDQYRYAQYAVANVFWHITPWFQTGLEYIYGRRVDYSGVQAHDNRIQTMLQLNF